MGVMDNIRKRTLGDRSPSPFNEVEPIAQKSRRISPTSDTAVSSPDAPPVDNDEDSGALNNLDIEKVQEIIRKAEQSDRTARSKYKKNWSNTLKAWHGSNDLSDQETKTALNRLNRLRISDPEHWGIITDILNQTVSDNAQLDDDTLQTFQDTYIGIYMAKRPESVESVKEKYREVFEHQAVKEAEARRKHRMALLDTLPPGARPADAAYAEAITKEQWDEFGLPNSEWKYKNVNETYLRLRSSRIQRLQHLVRAHERRIVQYGPPMLRDARSEDAQAEYDRFVTGEVTAVPDEDEDRYEYPQMWFPREVAHPSITTGTKAAPSHTETDMTLDDADAVEVWGAGEAVMDDLDHEEGSSAGSFVEATDAVEVEQTESELSGLETIDEEGEDEDEERAEQEGDGDTDNKQDGEHADEENEGEER